MNLAGKKGYQVIYTVSIVLLCLFQACNKDTTCLTPKVVALRGGFYYEDSVDVFKDTVQANANLFFGSNLSYYLNIKKSSKFYLSLAQNRDSVTIYFQSDSASTEPETIDSFSVVYSREPHFISTACGYETFFSIQSIRYTTNVIDTLIVSHNAVNNDVNKEHIKIVIKK